MRHTKIVGIVNVTPDSFSEPNRASSPDDFISLTKRLLAEGADAIDAGAESTRPGATAISAKEEWRRLEILPELVALCHQAGKIISLDTRHPETATKAIAMGVDWINDVAGGTPGMLDAVKGARTKLVLMHSLGIPADPKVTLPENADAVEEVRKWAERKLEQLGNAGIGRERIILDPGVGFGKTKTQSLDLILRVEELQKLNMPLLIGHSRKSFLTLFGDAAAEERDDVTLALSSHLMKKNIDFLRVHNVGRHATLKKLLAA